MTSTGTELVQGIGEKSLEVIWDLVARGAAGGAGNGTDGTGSAGEMVRGGGGGEVAKVVLKGVGMGIAPRWSKSFVARGAGVQFKLF